MSSIIVTVPLLISRCARACIHGIISARNDIYDSQVKLYKLSVKEQEQLQSLLEDYGFKTL